MICETFRAKAGREIRNSKKQSVFRKQGEFAQSGNCLPPVGTTTALKSGLFPSQKKGGYVYFQPFYLLHIVCRSEYKNIRSRRWSAVLLRRTQTG